MQDTENTQWYPIRHVAKVTGVNPITLRAWQRRYGLIKPHRTEKGHRLYSDEDIVTIQRILAWLDKGVAIRNVKPLLLDESGAAPTKQMPEVGQLLEALAQLNVEKAEKIVVGTFKEYPFKALKNRFVDPLEKALRCKDRPHRGLQYTLWRTLVIAYLSGLVSSLSKRNSKPCWLIRCGHRGHTLAWLTAWDLSNQGYKVNVLDGIQEKLSPFVDLIKTSSTVPVKVVVVGDQQIKPAIINELQRLPSKPVLVGSIADIHRRDFS